MDSDDKAATESLVWEEKLQELKLRLQDVTQSRYRYHNTNRFLENLLYTNEKNFLAAIDTLKHQESVLNVELTRVEDMYKETLTEKQNRQRAVDATHHESVNALEKEVAGTVRIAGRVLSGFPRDISPWASKHLKDNVMYSDENNH